MNGYNIIEIIPQVTMLEDDDACIYIVEGETHAVVIDTGYGIYNLKEAVEKITQKPLLVFYTHGHIDHAFGGHYFDRVYMSREDLPVYQYHKDVIRFQLSDRLKSIYNAGTEKMEKWLKAEPGKIEYTAHGDLFDIGGNTIEVIALKGHTPGSIGLIDRKHHILFSGDGIINHVWMQLPESSAIADYLNTVKNVRTYSKYFDCIYAGHRREIHKLSFLDELELTLMDLLDGAKGKKYNNQIASGMIYKRDKCEVVYNPKKIR